MFEIFTKTHTCLERAQKELSFDTQLFQKALTFAAYIALENRIKTEISIQII
jgi:hypothetical protein